MASILVLFATFAAAQSPPRPQQGDDADRQRDSATAPVPAPAAQQPALPGPQSPTTNRQTRDYADEMWDWLLSLNWSNWALAAIGVWAARVALENLRALTTQLKLSRAAVSAARTTAQAAMKQARAAEQHMYLALRARMGFVKIRAVNFAPNAETRFRLRFKNYGGKGAMVIDCRAIITVAPLPDVPDYSTNCILVTLGTPWEAGSAFDITLTLVDPITPEIWYAIHEPGGTMRFSIYAAMRYKAGFSEVVKEVGFCRSYDPDQSRADGKPVFVGAGGSKYNYAD